MLFHTKNALQKIPPSFAPLRELFSFVSKNKSHAKAQRRKENLERCVADGHF
jgi:hypothetical protein